MAGTPAPEDGGYGRRRFRARLLGGTVAGSLEIVLFHPVDTAAKRLIVNRRAAYHGGVSACSGTGLQAEFRSPVSRFREARSIVLGGLDGTATVADQLRSIYRGASFAVVYKVMQRCFQYSVQPAVARHLAANFRPAIVHRVGHRLAQPLEHAVAGCAMGNLEVVLLPIDSLKVKRQTSRPLDFRASASEGWLAALAGLYRGAACTIVRNGVGSFTFFGGAALTKEWLLGLEDYESATVQQHFVSCTAAAALSIAVSGPFDVLKTRVQRQGGGATGGISAVKSGSQIARDLVREEGVLAFFKGTVPKVVVVGPKLMFSYTVAQGIFQFFLSTEFPR